MLLTVSNFINYTYNYFYDYGNHGGIEKPKVQAVIKVDQSNQFSKTGDKHDVKTGARKTDDVH